MDRTEETRLAWQRAQADLQSALADLERAVASNPSGEELMRLRSVAKGKEGLADDLLQRHITQLGKS